MSILDTTAYFKSVYTQEYIPFEDVSSKDENIYSKNKWDNFCPICHYNYNSHYHKTHCNNNLPLIGDMLLLLFGFIYLIIKIKLWKR